METTTDGKCPVCRGELPIHNAGCPLVELGLGPTGEFPEGKLRSDDEGEIQIAIGTHNGNVIIDFGGPVAWIGLPPAQAIAVGEAIIERARSLKDGT